MAIKQYSLMADGNRRLAPDFKVRELRCRDGSNTVMMDEVLTVVLQCIRDYIEPLREKVDWGYSIPYMISGMLNQHPRESIKFIESGDAKDIVRFYDEMSE